MYNALTDDKRLTTVLLEEGLRPVRVFKNSIYN